MRERIGTINASFPVFQNTFHVLTRQLPTLFGVLFFLVLVEELFNISLFFYHYHAQSLHNKRSQLKRVSGKQSLGYVTTN